MKNAPIVSDLYTVGADVGVNRIFNGFQSVRSRLGRMAVGRVGSLAILCVGSQSVQSDGGRMGRMAVGYEKFEI